jgi:hypothetical protein
MNDYQPALDQLRERRKGKPGELLLMTGLVAMIVAPFGLFLTNQESGNLSDLKAGPRAAKSLNSNSAMISVRNRNMRPGKRESLSPYRNIRP